MTSVTHPATGLPSKSGWLPTIKEVTDSCNAVLEPIIQHELRLKRIKDQMEARAREERGEKPTEAQMKARFGAHWGLKNPDPLPIDNWGAGKEPQAPGWDKITAHYSANPELIQKLSGDQA